MIVNDVTARIQRFNEDRDPERRQRKFARMRENPFAFFRGSAHLFYEDWPDRSPLDDAPPAWICGDLHLENFGSYRGDNGLAYFDLNDFDEAVLAPPTWEVARFLTSVFVAADMLKLPRADSTLLGKTFLTAYTTALIDGKARWIERDCATGMVRRLLRSVEQRSHRAILKARTTGTGLACRLRNLENRTLPATPADRRMVVELVGQFAEHCPDPRYYKVLDVAQRVAGLGSLGVARFAVLVRGHDMKNGQRLLDLKHESPSVLLPRLRIPQPAWASEAVRVATIQHRAQAVPPGHLYAVGQNFRLRELQPMEDRLALAHWDGKVSRLRNVMTAMGELTAWSQLRCAGRDGAASTDALIAFGRARDWQTEVVRYARQYRDTVVKDWRAFVAAGG